MDVSKIHMEPSTKERGIAPMSAADDVIEMQSLAELIASKFSATKKDKDRTNALYAALNPHAPRKELFSWNRCYEFLKGRARSVHSWEKDLARLKADAIQKADRERRAAEHIDWLRSIHQSATASGSDMDRSEIAALERVLSRVGALDSAMGNPGEPRRRATD